MRLKTFVLGDVHGRYEALKEVLKKSGFRYSVDRLISLGDICDGGSQTKQCVEELLKIKNFILIKGNHDKWFMKFMENGFDEEIWIQQGGGETLKSYGASVKVADRITDTSLIDISNINIPVTHQDFFNRAVNYHVEDNMCFVHGGFNPYKHPRYEKEFNLIWDRELINFAMKGGKIPYFKKIFVGHTTIQTFGNNPFIKDCMAPIKINPRYIGNPGDKGDIKDVPSLFCLDAGSGWSGKLAIMDIHTEEYWTSKKQEPVR